jgi:polyphenol oxidase
MIDSSPRVVSPVPSRIREDWPQPSGDFRWRQVSGRWVLECSPLAPAAGHFFTTCEWPLRARHAGEDHVWDEVARSIGVEPDLLGTAWQVHGVESFLVTPATKVGERQSGRCADILLTDQAGFAVAVQVADCLPVLMADERTGAVAAVHAGWRGTVAGVVPYAVDSLSAAFGTRPTDLCVAVGPAIGACCYEVGEEVVEAFRRAGHGPDRLGRWFVEAGPARPKLDLWRATREQLQSAGVLPERIHVSGLCTACHPNVFFSYRREGPGAGRMAGVIKRLT